MFKKKCVTPMSGVTLFVLFREELFIYSYFRNLHIYFHLVKYFA
ncbi:hypothetical protein [Bacillus sp. THAF10]|nr:hypothetical protein [Bacillus sp. THAF10]